MYEIVGYRVKEMINTPEIGLNPILLDTINEELGKVLENEEIGSDPKFNEPEVLQDEEEQPEGGEPQ